MQLLVRHEHLRQVTPKKQHAGFGVPYHAPALHLQALPEQLSAQPALVTVSAGRPFVGTTVKELEHICGKFGLGKAGFCSTPCGAIKAAKVALDAPHEFSFAGLRHLACA
jgi:hypothetical protein